MKTIDLQAKLLLDGKAVSIPNSYAKKAFPYWISNPTGAKLYKIKSMIGSIIAGVGGGTLSFKLYSHPDDPIVSNNGEDISITKIDETWTLLTEMDYSIDSTEILFAKEYKYVNIDIKESSYLIGIISLTGDIIAEDLFVWIDYENNPI